jgi:catechol 2,3-dioxygenase-like lactoylglutathione lyase family enzyme
MSVFPDKATVDHIGICVKPENWETAVKLYTDVLGFELKKTWEGEIYKQKVRFSFLSPPGRDDFHIELIQWPNVPEGLLEICFRVNDIEAVYDEFKKKGITLAWGVRGEPFPPDKKWLTIADGTRFAYIPPEVFSGAHPPYGIELAEWETSMEEVYKTELKPMTFGP